MYRTLWCAVAVACAGAACSSEAPPQSTLGQPDGGEDAAEVIGLEDEPAASNDAAEEPETADAQEETAPEGEDHGDIYAGDAFGYTRGGDCSELGDILSSTFREAVGPEGLTPSELPVGKAADMAPSLVAEGDMLYAVSAGRLYSVDAQNKEITGSAGILPDGIAESDGTVMHVRDGKALAVSSVRFEGRTGHDGDSRSSWDAIGTPRRQRRTAAAKRCSTRPGPRRRHRDLPLGACRHFS